MQHADSTIIFPAKHFVTTEDQLKQAAESIKNELLEWAPTISNPIYRERIEKRVAHDLEMLQEVGYCSGIENYSAHFDGEPVVKNRIRFLTSLKMNFYWWLMNRIWHCLSCAECMREIARVKNH